MNARYILQAIAFLLILSTTAFFEAYPVPCVIAVAIAAVLTVIGNVDSALIKIKSRQLKVDPRIYKKKGAKLF